MADRSVVHHHAATCVWSGSTGAGYDTYDRTHEVGCAPADAGLRLSSDPAFSGDPSRLNPEALLLAADGRAWLRRMTLRPTITVRGTVSEGRLRRLVDLAHRECFVANSLRSEMTIVPTFVRA